MPSPSTASASAYSATCGAGCQPAGRLLIGPGRVTNPVAQASTCAGPPVDNRSHRTLADWYGHMEQAETGEGWGSWCERHGLYVAVCQEMISAVSARLPRPAVEIAAGSGELAQALGIVATDPEPGSNTVLRMDARQTLQTLGPENVLTCFAPIDAGIEQAILSAPSVRRYLYIGPTPPSRSNWTAETLPDVEPFLLTRLDYLTDFTRRTHQRRAYAVLLKRDPHVAP